ncbi:hypothetical protein JANAI62_23240 [Jannaschia pagri]|uniref:DUF3995 domain-containing protein n=1 Tax=Jannaschia pagri TaxID=2829797 RepID=A0ABQ4NMV6_9RHOB|nr:MULTISPECIES: DUF3995 domain-containing protein [unclassified Jannaschia]GIT91867.1 hypothetical protein JANAI61_23250 [Jannaschia sp. AI_61]GIT95701.1 hypothetical protein JANAI62_23240 [Jannaschia sp. AI_62]
MILAAVIWTVVLADVAALHLLWAARIWVPVRDETGLARAVVGRRGITQMPGPVACGAVALALLIAATLPWWSVFGWRASALFAAAVVFGVRGLAIFIPAWRDMTPEQPFRRLDAAAYGPMCLALGALGMTLAAAA